MDDERPWQGLKFVFDSESREVLVSPVSISVGDGKKTLFWHDSWIHARTVVDIAPTIASLVPTRIQKVRTVQQVTMTRT